MKQRQRKHRRAVRDHWRAAWRRLGRCTLRAHSATIEWPTDCVQEVNRK